jgi:hypothetical protein
VKNTSLKISAVLLCGLLIYNSLGYFMVLSVMRVALRHQKWTQLSLLPNEVLTSFTIDKNSSGKRIKMVNNREILINGKLYDIVRKKVNGSATTYYCKQDKEEESLISKTRLLNSKAQQMPVQNKARFMIEKIIKSGIISEKIIFNTDRCIILLAQSTKVQYSGPPIRISLPPPKSCC